VKGDRSLPEDANGNVLLPRAQLDAIADALLFYLRGFTNPDEEVAATPELLDDYGARAARAFEGLGDDIMVGAMKRAEVE
jgi:hypothetical protein